MMVHYIRALILMLVVVAYRTTTNIESRIDRIVYRVRGVYD
jgi:hypothetical protein